ncbi:MAG: RluA family pseudouridine synthase [Candidatus Doudnabacteria bacterium]|nr:RluA family pseudouridine synthase [Candidatus Doudnabacteria bacterium]
MRLDKFLAEKHTEVSRGKIQKAIKDGLVLVNGKKVLETDFQVTESDQVELPKFQDYQLSPINYQLKVIYENQDLAVIDKPAGLMVHPAAGRTDDTLAHALLARFPGIEKVGDPHRPGIVHRLDEDTSGLLLIAKTQAGYDYLKNLFQTRNIEKEYLALVHGGMENLHGVIDAPIGKTSTHTKMRVGEGREAVTEYSLLTSDRLNQYSLLKVKLHTGRTHQIRVHLASIGHPVMGDQLYGGQFKQKDVELLGRQFLHASRLKLRLQDGTWLELESELPEDLRQVLTKLEIRFTLSKPVT